MSPLMVNQTNYTKRVINAAIDNFDCTTFVLKVPTGYGNELQRHLVLLWLTYLSYTYTISNFASCLYFQKNMEGGVWLDV